MLHYRDRRRSSGHGRMGSPPPTSLPTRGPVPFEAEAFAPANSAANPLLTNTVWIVRRTPNPGIALAHVLTDNGAHSRFG